MRARLNARLARQLNNDNRGASLVTVLTISAIVAIFATAVIAIVILNVNMRRADLQGQDNFYDAESALEEVREGLAQDVSYATSIAYIDTLKNYDTLDDEEAKVKHFNKKFLEALRSSDNVDDQGRALVEGGRYNLEKLNGYLRETKNNAVVGVAYEDEGKNDQIYKDTTDAVDPEDPNYNETKLGAVLKNVRVSYVDPSTNFESKIKTDIVLGYPEVNFQNAGSADNILTYGLIANDTFKAKSDVKIIGNAFIGDKEASVEDDSDDEAAADISGAKRLQFIKADDADETTVICGGDIKLTNASDVIADRISLWAESLRINRSDFESTPGSNIYLKNDLELQNGGKATLAGKLVMFGNFAALGAGSQMWNLDFVKEDVRDHPADYSSAILVSGTGTKLDMSKLGTMVIGGSSYIDTESNRAAILDDWANKNLTTGQSLMLRTDQRAYMVPAEVSLNGNPMTNAQFINLQNKIISDKNYDNAGQIQPNDYVDYNKVDSTLGFSVYGFYATTFGPIATGIDLAQFDKWQSEDAKSGNVFVHSTDNTVDTPVEGSKVYQGVKEYKADHDAYLRNPQNYKYTPDDLTTTDMRIIMNYIRYEYILNRPTVAINAYRSTTANTPIMYLFIQFRSFGDAYNMIQGITFVPAEALYNEWYRQYNANATNKSKLLSNLSYYTSGGGIKLPSNAESDPSRMYFTGNMLSSDNVDIVVHDWLTKGLTSDLANQYYAQSADYNDAFFTMKRNLSKNYATLLDIQKKPNLFDNLIATSVTVNNHNYSIGDHGDTAYYISDTGEVAVVTTKNNYTYDGDEISYVKQKYAVKYPDGDSEKAQVNVIISTHDVTVASDYEGMIIAKGDVIVNSGRTVKADTAKVAKAISASWDSDNENSKYDCAANFIIGANRFRYGGAGEVDPETGNVSLANYVTYRNWTRE